MMNKNINYTEDTRNMIIDNLGYRTGHPQYIDPRSVINFEMNELHNKDIPDTITRLYGDLKPLGHPIKSYNDVIEWLEKYYPDYINGYIIWLCNKKYVWLYHYDEQVYQYKITDSDLVISDLGQDGALFLTTNKPLYDEVY